MKQRGVALRDVIRGIQEVLFSGGAVSSKYKCWKV